MLTMQFIYAMVCLFSTTRIIMLNDLIGKEVSLYYYDEFILTGTLSKHKGNNPYYQVTDSNLKHFVINSGEVLKIDGNKIYI